MMLSQEQINELIRAIKALTNGKLKEVPDWILNNWDTFSYNGEEYEDGILRPNGAKFALQTTLSQRDGRLFGICKYSRIDKKYYVIYQIIPVSKVFTKLLHMIGMNGTNDYCNHHAYHGEDDNLVIMFKNAINEYLKMSSQDFEYCDLFYYTEIVYYD